MSEEIKKKIPLRDKRKHLSDKYIKPLPFEETTYSVGDDTVIGLRIFVNKGGTKTFYYVNSAKDIKERKDFKTNKDTIKEGSNGLRSYYKAIY